MELLSKAALSVRIKATCPRYHLTAGQAKFCRMFLNLSTLPEGFALPREAMQDNQSNALRYCLGKECLIVFQGVSEWPPKPEREKTLNIGRANQVKDLPCRME
jgi:hypothetical protein